VLYERNRFIIINKTLTAKSYEHKAQWVVKGFEQRFDINYNEMFAAVVKFMTYKVIFVIAAHYDYKLKQMNE